MLKIFNFILLIIIFNHNCFSQQASKSILKEDLQNINRDLSKEIFKVNDSIYVYMSAEICKNPILILFYQGTVATPIYQESVATPTLIVVPPIPQHVPLIKIHGNVLYNFSYRSYIDTPFTQKDLVQHLIQTDLNILIKNRYPIKMTISNRSSNSSYFKNTTDVNFKYNRMLMLDNIKEDLKNKIERIADANSLKEREQLYSVHKKQAQQLQAWVNSPARIQEIIEEKELKLNGHQNNQDKGDISTNKDKMPLRISDFNELPKNLFTIKEMKGGKKDYSKFFDQKSINNEKTILNENSKLSASNEDKVKDSSCTEKLDAKKMDLKKLLAEINYEEANLKQSKKRNQDSLNQIKKEINKLSNAEDLYTFMKRNGISKDSLSKTQRILLSIDQIGIGKSFIDYSELTVKNVSLTGINIEANPGNLYIAAAAGKINYLYRDFILKNDYNVPDQSLFLLRAGMGKKEKNNFILTFFNGKKAVLNSIPGNNSSSLQKVLGISAETRLAINANNYIIAEIAKSSFNNAGLEPRNSDLLKKAFDLKIHSNEAYSIKLYSQNPGTDTRLIAYYKKMGENFQSFNLYPVNVNEASWMIRANQYVWNRKISIDAAIRKNDFLSPIAMPSKFSTKTIFKSFQASLRMRKFPFISIGYYPTSQLSLTDNNVLTESQYNTLNTVLSYNYHLSKISMNTNAVFTKFYNAGSDTGFIYFNASSYTLNHTIFLSSFTLQSSVGVTNQIDFDLFTLEQSLSYQIKNNFSLMAGLKWNRANNLKNLYGGTAAMSIYVQKIGTIQFNYDKSYLPGYDRTFKPVDMGRMSLYRDF